MPQGRENKMADNTPTNQTDADRIATFVDHVEAIDSTDLANVADAQVQKNIVDWGFVSYVESFADAGTAVIDGHVLTMDVEIEIHMNDGGTVRLDVVVKASDEDGIFGLKDIAPKVAAQV